MLLAMHYTTSYGYYFKTPSILISVGLAHRLYDFETRRTKARPRRVKALNCNSILKDIS